jgi:hypothetical protein
MDNVIVEGLCKCGRGYTHCRNQNCGGRNLYPLKYRSLSKSISIGRQVTVYRCKKCGNETDESMGCQAQPEIMTTDFKPFKKPQEALPWENLVPGTKAHYDAFIEAATELANKQRISLTKAFVQLITQGWDVTKYELDDDTREALREAGLGAGDEGSHQSGRVHGPAESGNAEQSSATAQAPVLNRLKEEDVIGPTQTAEPLSLDEIIKGMQEEAK